MLSNSFLKLRLVLRSETFGISKILLYVFPNWDSYMIHMLNHVLFYVPSYQSKTFEDDEMDANSSFNFSMFNLLKLLETSTFISVQHKHPRPGSQLSEKRTNALAILAQIHQPKKN